MKRTTTPSPDMRGLQETSTRACLQEYILSRYDPSRPHENLGGLFDLLHLREKDPAMHRAILIEYGRMHHAFKEVLGLSHPLKEGFLHSIGVHDEALFILERDGEDAARKYASSWSADSRTFDRWTKNFPRRREQIITAAYKEGRFTDDPLARVVLANRGITDLANDRQGVLDDIRRISEDEGLVAVLHLKGGVHHDTYLRAKRVFGRITRALDASGITQQSIQDLLIETGEIKDILFAYLRGDESALEKTKAEYKIDANHWRWLLERFEKKRSLVLREDSNVNQGMNEGILDTYLHGVQVDGCYLLHQHQEPYAAIDPSLPLQMKCDFKIGPFWVEVDGGIAAWFPSYKERMDAKRKTVESSGAPFIVLGPDDFPERFADRLSPVLACAREGIERLIPEGLFDFTTSTQDYGHHLASEGQARHFRNLHAFWNRNCGRKA